MLFPASAKPFYMFELPGLKQSIFSLLAFEVEGTYCTCHQLFPSFPTLVTVLWLTCSSREYNSRRSKYSSASSNTSKLFLPNPKATAIPSSPDTFSQRAMSAVGLARIVWESSMPALGEVEGLGAPVQ